MKKILVLCTGNSCRSQIAEGYLKLYLNAKAVVFSAGINNHKINENAIKIMKEDGVDISTHTSNHINEYENINFDYIIQGRLQCFNRTGAQFEESQRLGIRTYVGTIFFKGGSICAP